MTNVKLGETVKLSVHFTSGERASGAYWIEGCVGPRTSLNVAMKRRIPVPARNQTLTIQPIVRHCTD